MYCKQCGSIIAEGGLFCSSCGEKVQAVEAAQVIEVEAASNIEPATGPVDEMDSSPEEETTEPAFDEKVGAEKETLQDRFNQSDQRPVEAQSKRVDPRDMPMTLGAWIGTLLLLLIPVVNIILPFVWAFGSDVNRSKKTYFQAMLLVNLVVIVLLIIFSSALALFFATFTEGRFY